jgi:hypothetical protein
MVFWKIGHEKVVVMKAWRTHERQRVGGSQRSGGHGYLPTFFPWVDYPRLICIVTKRAMGHREYVQGRGSLELFSVRG